jgi:ferredoxin
LASPCSIFDITCSLAALGRSSRPGTWRDIGTQTEEQKVATFQVTITTPTQEVKVAVKENQYLLDAAIEAGLDLPYMCLQGWCTTCAGRILHGKVDQSEARRYYPQDEAQGFVLLCSAYPRSDLRILTHQKEPMREHRRSLGLPAPRG